MLGSLFGEAEIPKFERVDLTKLQELARKTALENMTLQKEREMQFNPDLAQSRKILQQQTHQLLKLGGGDKATQRILSDFDLGGQLPIEIQNQIVAASGGRSAGSGGPLGALTARDIGQSAMALRDKRTQDLLSSYSSRVNQAAAVQAANPEPVVGLDPGAIASASIGDTNALNLYNATAAQIRSQNRQNQLNAIVGLAGAGANLFGTIVDAVSGGGGGGSKKGGFQYYSNKL